MYNNINPKYKSFLFFLIKLSIVVGALYFIYDKITQNNLLDFKEFSQQIRTVIFKNNLTLFILVMLTFFNWFFEILKWKTLVGTFKKITLYEATLQTFASLTTSLFTPNRIGEYGAKAVYHLKAKRKIMLLNFVGNLYQLGITIFFGIVGILFFLKNNSIKIQHNKIRSIGYIIAFIILMFIGGKKIKLFNYLKLDKIKHFIKNISSKVHLKIVAFSFVRYLLFSHQFYYLLLILGVETDYYTLLYLIFTMYVIASFIPSISLFDWAVKGSVAVYIFSFINISEIIIVTTTSLMWILNFAIPSVIGSYFVLTFKFSKE